jgi:hypothetical protein
MILRSFGRSIRPLDRLALGDRPGADIDRQLAFRLPHRDLGNLAELLRRQRPVLAIVGGNQEAARAVLQVPADDLGIGIRHELAGCAERRHRGGNADLRWKLARHRRSSRLPAAV